MPQAPRTGRVSLKEEQREEGLARSAWQLARKHAVVTPVIDETYAMLNEGDDICQGR